MRTLKLFVLTLVVLISFGVLEKKASAAPSAGLLRGMIGSGGVEFGNYPLLTDGLENPPALMSRSGQITFTLTGPAEINGYYLHVPWVNAASVAQIELYDTSNSLKGTFQSRTDESTAYTAITPVSNIKKIIVRNMKSDMTPNIYEVDVRGTISDTTPPATPTGLSATPDNGKVTLNWNAVADTDLSKYKVYMGGSFVADVTKPNTSYTKTGLTNGTNYSFQVSAVDNSDNESAKSQSVSATPFELIPNAPTGLTATGGDKTAVLNWSAVPGATGYNVYKDGVKINASPINATNYTATGLVNGTSYNFKISAVNSAGESGLSSAVTVVPFVPLPTIPTGLIATAGDKKAVLNWSAVPGATGYNVYKDGVKINASPINATNYTATGLVNGTSYNFKISAVNSAGESGLSSGVAVVPVAPVIPQPPPKPTGVTAAVSNEKVVLNWNPVPPPITNYIVYRDGIVIAQPTATTYTDTVVSNGTNYRYEISAVNADGESPKNQIFAKPANVTDFTGDTLPFSVLGMLKTAFNFLKLYSDYVLIVLGIIFAPVLLAIVNSLLGFDESKGKGKKGKGKKIDGVAKEANESLDKKERTPREKTLTVKEKIAKNMKETNWDAFDKEMKSNPAAIQTNNRRTERVLSKVEAQPKPKPTRAPREGRERKRDGSWTAREKKRHQEKMQAHIARMRSRTT